MVTTYSRCRAEAREDSECMVRFRAHHCNNSSRKIPKPIGKRVEATPPVLLCCARYSISISMYWYVILGAQQGHCSLGLQCTRREAIFGCDRRPWGLHTDGGGERDSEFSPTTQMSTHRRNAGRAIVYYFYTGVSSMGGRWVQPA